MKHGMMTGLVEKLRLGAGLKVTILGGFTGCGGGKAKRLPESGYQVVFESHKVATDMVSGKTVSADIAIKSISPVTWPNKSDHKNRFAVNLSYHWLNHKGEPVIFDGLRSPLPEDVGVAKPDGGAPGETRSGSIEPLASNINFHWVGGSTLDR